MNMKGKKKPSYPKESSRSNCNFKYKNRLYMKRNLELDCIAAS